MAEIGKEFCRPERLRAKEHRSWGFGEAGEMQKEVVHSEICLFGLISKEVLFYRAADFFLINKYYIYNGVLKLNIFGNIHKVYLQQLLAIHL